MNSVEYIHEQRRINPKLIALNMAYGILMDNSACFAAEIPLDGLANDIAAAILKGAAPETIESN